jgi:hypothetical protein
MRWFDRMEVERLRNGEPENRRNTEKGNGITERRE